jgi:F-type H+-transporting ATPase subunit a
VAGPLDQFEVKTIIPFQVGTLDLSFTNASLFMMLSAGLTVGLVLVGMRGARMVPDRLQAVAELLYEFVEAMVRDNGGPKAKSFVPVIFALFCFLLFGNLLGLIPYSFTFTSHIAVTLAMALTVFIGVTAMALMRHGAHFFSFFLPAGTPGYLAPLVVPVEIISYLSRPISLSVRLFANMLAGHIILKVFAGFTVSLGVAFGAGGYILGLIPVGANVLVLMLETLVGCLQAYVFALLTCVYIRDAIELH